jgi:hypothetical protein
MMPSILKAFPAMFNGHKTTVRNLQKKKKKKKLGGIEESITRSTRRSSPVAHLTIKTQRSQSLHQHRTREVTEILNMA